MTLCDREPLVRRAAAEDRWTDALRDHVRTCPDCAAAASAAPFMQRLSRLDDRRAPLPDPKVLWFKSQLLRANVAADRATRPLRFAQIAAYVVVAVGWAAMLTWKWTELQHWILGFTPAHMVEGLSGASSLSLTFIVAVALLGSATVMLAMHTILAEE